MADQPVSGGDRPYVKEQTAGMEHARRRRDTWHSPEHRSHTQGRQVQGHRTETVRETAEGTDQGGQRHGGGDRIGNGPARLLHAQEHGGDGTHAGQSVGQEVE